jgi:DNA-3-methyladenine glycosylase
MKRETVRSPRFVKLRRSFYVRPTLAVARDLLGVYLLRRVGPRTLIGRIVEVEAYRGSDDPASHAYRGRTKRNEVMFFKGGYLYVYFTYGMHYCANVVTGKSGTGSATLIRAVEPVGSVETLVNNRMRGRRGRSTPRSRRHASKPLERHQLCSGPARVCEAFALTGKDNGKDLCGRVKTSGWAGHPVWGSHRAWSGAGDSTLQEVPPSPGQNQAPELNEKGSSLSGIPAPAELFPYELTGS